MDWYKVVVSIKCRTVELDLTQPHNLSNINGSLGSGLFISLNYKPEIIDDKQIYTPIENLTSEYYVLTCYHVIQNALAIEIIYNQDYKFKASVYKIFPEDDLAVLKFSLDESNYKKQQDILKVTLLKFYTDININGYDVSSIGFPLKNPSIITTKGIISGFRNSMIQIDAALNNGNSGGPLTYTDTRTEEVYVIGVNTSKLSGIAENTGFSIPIKKFIQIYNYGIKLDETIIHRPYLDFEYQSIEQKELRDIYKITEDGTDLYINPPIGVIITEIYDDAYYVKDGTLLKDDVLVSINDCNVMNGFINLPNIFVEKIKLKELGSWFIPSDELDILLVRLIDGIYKKITKKLVFKNQTLNYRPFYYPLIRSDKFFIENNCLVISMFTSNHVDNLTELNYTPKQTIDAIHRILHYKDKFTVYLCGLHSDIYTNKKYIDYPINDIITHINDEELSSETVFFKYSTEPIKSFVTINNNKFFI